MKLYYTNTSPFARIVRLAILELGIADRLEMAIADPWTEESGLYRVNPLEKVPALELDDGRVLVDSLTIAEYLDRSFGENRLLPLDPAGWVSERRLAALAHGVIEAGVARLIERLRRPEPYRWAGWDARQKAKIVRTLDLLEGEVAGFAGTEPGLGRIALAAALGYMDFRFADDAWREGRPKLAAWYAAVADRPAMQQTMPG
ncbi:glutathione S-transferase family protein [Tistrella mobilis]|uniref:Glutathione S-transferase n=1 Tax=Tistrella mobilis (strain KA081020-065) TaxID=1110502 RepID=I3TGV1_TISMK|nr:glutathione S-transferase N-terminal domain-containing protein [Tistrella mobilis]AFK51989.1 Glutathione S-transferase [Tistrella mobilis KA081020-065]